MAWVVKMMDEVIDSVAQDLDISLSEIGQELGAGVYSMSDVLALPIFKQQVDNLPSENEGNNQPFQYVLCAATSPAVKLHDETITYLNQGQSYELRMLDNRKKGELPEINGKLVKSIVRVVFHDRRLQYSEHQQLEGWRWNRPGDRLLDLDIPMSAGIVESNMHPDQLNAVEFLWDPSKRASAFIKTAVEDTVGDLIPVQTRRPLCSGADKSWRKEEENQPDLKSTHSYSSFISVVQSNNYQIKNKENNRNWRIIS